MNKAYILAICMLGASFTGCIEDDDSLTLRQSVEDFLQAQEDRNGKKFCGYILNYDGTFISGETYQECLQSIDDTFDYRHTMQSFNSEKQDYKVNRNSGYVYSVSITVETCFRGQDSMDEWSCDIFTEDNTFWVEVGGKWGYGSYGLDKYYPAGESAPLITFFVSADSGGAYHVEVVKVSKQEDLEEFSYYLKDESGSTYFGGNGFGEVAMQIIKGEAHGIETYYGGDDEQLERRADNVTNDDGSQFPVHFSDNDRDGKLSAGDEFTVYGQGNSANGPAENNWKLDIQFDASGDIIGSAKLL
tara:strand:- start:39 stop:944 length:906 start_codon:yes stop_codon:yes gene_type:complete